ncbi:phage head morphogenesis protein [Clostridium botulinum]|nr:phage head morphogenesis protein [Clostridium botulinum]NFS52947.1 phage head morphogenesis protein [Clostridium botulinum]NFT16469.1 phage head morphogenesis protein [Clostridium botulinum]
MDKSNNELEFVESLYNEADEQLKEVYKIQKTNRDELLKEIGNILLIYTIADGVMNMSKQERDKEHIKLFKIIKTFRNSSVKKQEEVITNILNNTVKGIYDFYSYNYKLKDVKKIIDNNFKGKHFSKRVWDNETTVAKRLHMQCQEFLKGKVSVNQIKKDIEKTFNTSAFIAKRLTETEVSRCQNESFKKFCNETDVKKLKYNATLCNSCPNCMDDDGKIFDINNAPDLPKHPCCHCYYEIEE